MIWSATASRPGKASRISWLSWLAGCLVDLEDAAMAFHTLDAQGGRRILGEPPPRNPTAAVPTFANSMPGSSWTGCAILTLFILTCLLFSLKMTRTIFKRCSFEVSSMKHRMCFKHILHFSSNTTRILFKSCSVEAISMKHAMIFKHLCLFRQTRQGLFLTVALLKQYQWKR